MGALKIFGTLWNAHGYFSLKFMGFNCPDQVPSERALVSSYRPSRLQYRPTYYFSISTRLPKILDCSHWGLWILRKGRPSGIGDGTIRKSVGEFLSPPYILFLYQHSFARNFRLQFWVGAANPQFRGRGSCRGSGMVPFERALVSFYRPSTVILFLYLYAFKRYCSFCSLACHFFPTPPPVSPKFPDILLGVGGSPFDYKERRCWANCPCN